MSQTSQSNTSSNRAKICMLRNRRLLGSSAGKSSSILQKIQQNVTKDNVDVSQVPSHVFVTTPTGNDQKVLVKFTYCKPVVLLQGRALQQDHQKLYHHDEEKYQKGECSSQLQRSLIEQLLEFEGEGLTCGSLFGKKVGLQQLDILQTQSIQEEGSSIIDKISEAIELTEQEQLLFNNFQDNTHRWLKGEVQIFVRAPQEHVTFIEERKKVIRNFFKPKGSFLKDDKTRCNSSTNLDEITESNKNSNIQRQCEVMQEGKMK